MRRRLSVHGLALCWRTRAPACVAVVNGRFGDVAELFPRRPRRPRSARTHHARAAVQSVPDRGSRHYRSAREMMLTCRSSHARLAIRAEQRHAHFIGPTKKVTVAHRRRPRTSSPSRAAHHDAVVVRRVDLQSATQVSPGPARPRRRRRRAWRAPSQRPQERRERHVGARRSEGSAAQRAVPAAIASSRSPILVSGPRDCRAPLRRGKPPRHRSDAAIAVDLDPHERGRASMPRLMHRCSPPGAPRITPRRGWTTLSSEVRLLRLELESVP